MSAIKELHNDAMLAGRNWKLHYGMAEAEVLWKSAITPQEVSVGRVVVEDL
ncbi:hypothetical protein ACX80T_15135 [Arthrobacter sp. Sr33]